MQNIYLAIRNALLANDYSMKSARIIARQLCRTKMPFYNLDIYLSE